MPGLLSKSVKERRAHPTATLAHEAGAVVGPRARGRGTSIVPWRQAVDRRNRDAQVSAPVESTTSRHIRWADRVGDLAGINFFGTHDRLDWLTPIWGLRTAPTREAKCEAS